MANAEIPNLPILGQFQIVVDDTKGRFEVLDYIVEGQMSAKGNTSSGSDKRIVISEGKKPMKEEPTLQIQIFDALFRSG
ncbi:hypothetical protein RIF29_23903 [Crotalaria pallida]|uniref:Uncharacterized protein n=1 Tax=Crotalaria pallida TaxID=3830 RepID=A0AAN9ENX8_CROPI